jgi:citrate lyase beta subunit
MTYKTISPWHLGAPLYMPAHRLDLLDIANGDKLPFVRAMIFCTEDAITKTELESSLRHLSLCLQGFKTIPERYRFIRARNPQTLARLLDLPAINNIDGFVLPKFSVNNFNAYFDLIKGTDFKVMPTLETRDVFDNQAMRELQQALSAKEIINNVLMLRIGGNDLMNLLGMRRPRGLTLYDTPLNLVISQLATIFKPFGFHLSAPVFEYLNDITTLEKEIALDLAHGLTGKTAIHPEQIKLIERCYAVENKDYEMAVKLCEKDAPAVFKMYDAMCEVATHKQWAQTILHRHYCYGIKENEDKQYLSMGA